MNPFLHPTVATALAPADPPHWSSPGGPGRILESRIPPAGRERPPIQAGRGVRARWCRAAGTIALAAGIGVGASQDAVGQPALVNVNIATNAELQTVKGIGPKTAQIIIQERERTGPFESFQDFAERIRGIGPKKAQALRAAGLTVSGGAAPGLSGETIR